jgi:hypothetical protein
VTPEVCASPASRFPRHFFCFNRERRLFNHHPSSSKGKTLFASHFLFLASSSHLTIKKMFAKLTTKIALRKAGIPSSALSLPDYQGSKDPNASPFANVSNPFANLTVPNSLKSWATPPPPPVEIAPVPILGTRAPGTNKLRLPVEDGRPSIVVFLRHCGCPCMFSELLCGNKY